MNEKGIGVLVKTSETFAKSNHFVTFSLTKLKGRNN